MIETYDADRVETALKSAAEKWKGTKNKNGRTYPITNMAWVDWAQAELDQGTTKITQYIWEAWTDNQKKAYIDAGGDIPYA